MKITNGHVMLKEVSDGGIISLIVRNLVLRKVFLRKNLQILKVAIFISTP